MPTSEAASRPDFDSGAHAAASRRAEKPLNIVFGVERIGLLPIRHPRSAVAIAIALLIAAVFGVQRIKIDDSLSQLFRAKTQAFKRFEEVSRRFPSNAYDVLVVVEGKPLLERESIEKLRNVVTDLQLVDGARGILSLFPARQPDVEGGLRAPDFPNEPPQGANYMRLVHRLMDNDLIRGKLLSDDGSLALIVLSLDPAVTEGGKLSPVITDVRRTLNEDLRGSGLISELSGVPVMQLEIRNAVERDRIICNALGFFAGCLIAVLFFRRVSFMIVATGPPLIAVAFALGALGWLGFRLNIFLNVMTPLILVISFSDSMQLTFAARDRLISGEDGVTAFSHAIRVVGPACVLTHATAALSFLALLASDSELIRTFGEAGFIATLIALFSVLSLAPALGVLLAPKRNAFGALGSADAGIVALHRICGWIAVRMTRQPGLYSVIGLFVVCSLGAVYLGLQPRYRLADQVPDRDQAMWASGRIDAKLTGANPIDVLIEFPKGADLYSAETLDTIARVHGIVETRAGIGNVWSPETLRRWLPQKLGKSDVATMREYVDLLPQYLVRRFLSEDHMAVLVSGRIPDNDSAELLPVVNRLDKELNAARLEHPGYTIAVTGLSVIAARNSADVIGKLNRGLTVEFAFVAAFIGLAFRSIAVTMASIVTGIFPVVCAGTLLRPLGDGLQFASVVALTVSFGLGLSATIHFMNRLWREIRSDEAPGAAVERATVLVGPALILTSIVLTCGLAATAFSNLPPLRMFGWLSVFAMLAALVADLSILRPTITFLLSRARLA